MNGNEIVEKYPLATQTIMAWMLAEIEESCKDPLIPEDFKKYIIHVGVTIERVVGIIDKTPGMLFEAFDAQHIFCEIPWMSGTFGVKVYSKHTSSPFLEGFNTRKEANIKAIEESFKILENQPAITTEEWI